VSPTELCQRTRITQRELQWWTATGVIASTSTARGRDFEDDQALTVAIVAELRRKGVSLHRIRQLHIRHPHREYLAVSQTAPGGRTCFWWCRPHDLVESVAAHPGPCLVVCIEDLRKRLYDQDPPRFSRRARN
jgi:DNA-binding transcriptional MerR regulator